MNVIIGGELSKHVNNDGELRKHVIIGGNLGKPIIIGRKYVESVCLELAKHVCYVYS